MKNCSHCWYFKRYNKHDSLYCLFHGIYIQDTLRCKYFKLNQKNMSEEKKNFLIEIVTVGGKEFELIKTLTETEDFIHNKLPLIVTKSIKIHKL